MNGFQPDDIIAEVNGDAWPDKPSGAGKNHLIDYRTVDRIYPLGLIFALSGLFLLSSLGIGLFASTVANTQQEAFITVMVTMLPSIFLSGFFFPIEAMPKFLQYISAIVPLRYYLVIIRALLLKGVGAAALQSEIIALTIFAIAIMGAAALRFRKRLD